MAVKEYTEPERTCRVCGETFTPAVLAEPGPRDRCRACGEAELVAALSPRARIAELEAELAQLREALDTEERVARYGEGGLWRFWAEKARSYARRNSQLREALSPFAECANELDRDDAATGRETPDDERAKFRLLAGHYRQARKTLSGDMGRGSRDGPAPTYGGEG